MCLLSPSPPYPIPLYTHVLMYIHTPTHVLTIWCAQIQQVGKESLPGSGPLLPLPADNIGCSQEMSYTLAQQVTHNSPSPSD